ncbi:poly(ADP-ribose) glycohydrolase 1 [Ricinus communis]|uniref:poly(ADP-ribose) glycohydrolase n=1 Tax=Ricinus communis TaxID=3988 RepID=B9T530_RICCO|nr:poly(ADP-ribose) glycohydrolase 1 [Ricinus communis]EEF29034.1 poly(ADP-ribose) glycohydrolase, putative [Ricinus communis]|eukprot:XP_002533349.1 poly(ADP-ribose) glycohydrolase 1 [Ricinus communis]
MESREDLKSVIPFLPLVIRSSALSWPSQVVETLKELSRGPDFSNVNSGELLFYAISDLRNSLSLSTHSLAPSAQQGYALFFDELISRAESKKWFQEVLPALANLALRLPSLLELHYQTADSLLDGVKTGLRLLGPQEAGIVYLSQELIGALLACAFFCLFPVTGRGVRHLPVINFDHLFEILYDNYSEKQENKIKCIIHYFERICSCTPVGSVSFERKVLPLEQLPECISYPKADFWNESAVPLCPFEVHNSGFIEDQISDALEVDFANKYLGGGALHSGCVQEEIRFMINPELIAGMFFLPCMEDNEAIEIVGAERFSDYTGYASSFRFSGDYVDKSNIDSFGRHKTRIVAIDALCSPGLRQYELKYLLREINKAFCGFYDQSKCDYHKRSIQHTPLQGTWSKLDNNFLSNEAPSASADTEMYEGEPLNGMVGDSDKKHSSCLRIEDRVGIATGNWGCGAFGGDPELKAIIQWLAASQASRPFVLYYTFGTEALRNLDKVSQWILSHEWTVGDLWNMLEEYSFQRFNRETKVGFFAWLLPSLITHEADTSLV